MAKRIPSLNWLRVFEAAARSGSFAKAAETRNMSTPAVSQQIKALETHLGRPLFDRGPHSVTLTEAGRAFLPTIAQSLNGIEIATTSLFGDRDRTPLTVQCSLSLACGWLAPRLPAFQSANPTVALTLTTYVHERELQTHDADLRLTFGLPPGPSEDSDPLFGEVLRPVAPPEIADRISKPGDLTNFKLIEIATHRANWGALLPPDGPEPRITYTDNTLAAFAMAQAGAIALDRQPATGDLANRHGLVACLPGLSVPGVQNYSLVYPARSGLNRAARAFREWLLEEAVGTSWGA